MLEMVEKTHYIFISLKNETYTTSQGHHTTIKAAMLDQEENFVLIRFCLYK